MRKLYLFAAMAAMLAACSSDDLTVEKQVAQQNADDGAVNFSAYVGRNVTRAGLSGDMNLAALQKSAADNGGFGVFAYYTDGEYYASNTKPNFMYNQGVFYKSSSGPWEYSPIKYWPNEFGNDAISDQVDRVSFFAYAPYVEVDPLTGIVKSKNTENITGMTRNNATGDPFIKYTATMDATNSVDLCWAVAANDFTSSNSSAFPNDIKKGTPYVNVVKPGLNGKIAFDFKHALAKLNVQVDAVVNDKAPTTTQFVDNDKFTRIWVRSVTFEGITLKGALNLRNGEWYQIDASGDNKISTGTVTVYDGLKDGKEPTGTAASETPAALNPAIIQSVPYDRDKVQAASDPALQTTNPTEVKGVIETPQNLFKKTTNEADPIYVIPTGEQMKVTIVYDVETYDKNLAYYLSDGATQGSTIQNTITKTINSFGSLEAGYWYTLKLHLGMRSIDFEAQVSEWDDSHKAADADLPSNLPVFTLGTGGPTSTVYLGASEPDYEFALAGADANGTFSKNTTYSTPSPGTAPDNIEANGAGVGVGKLTGITANNDTKEKNPLGKLVYQTNISGTTPTTINHSITFKQKGQPLNLTLNNITAGETTLTLGWNTAITARTKANQIANETGEYIKVYKNGVLLTEGSSNDYELSTTNTDITLSTAAKQNDIFKVEIKSGDVPVESVTKTVP